MSKSPITCHILDSTLGKPASYVQVQLEMLSSSENQFHVIAKGQTNSDGRCSDLLLPPPTPESEATVLHPNGIYKMVFFTKDYFDKMGRETFYPRVEILFHLPNTPDPHYHIPLLLSPFSYTTYRGS